MNMDIENFFLGQLALHPIPDEATLEQLRNEELALISHVFIAISIASGWIDKEAFKGCWKHEIEEMEKDMETPMRSNVLKKDSIEKENTTMDERGGEWPDGQSYDEKWW